MTLHGQTKELRYPAGVGGGGAFSRETQRLLSVKYPVRKRKSCLEFSIARGRVKIPRGPFHYCTIFEA